MTPRQAQAMTVTELIKRLQQLPGDLPVYLGDWNEQYAADSPLGASDGPTVMSARDVRRRGLSLPRRVVIGGSCFSEPPKGETP